MARPLLKCGRLVALTRGTAASSHRLLPWRHVVRDKCEWGMSVRGWNSRPVTGFRCAASGVSAPVRSGVRQTAAPLQTAAPFQTAAALSACEACRGTGSCSLSGPVSQLPPSPSLWHSKLPCTAGLHGCVGRKTMSSSGVRGSASVKAQTFMSGAEVLAPFEFGPPPGRIPRHCASQNAGTLLAACLTGTGHCVRRQGRWRADSNRDGWMWTSQFTQGPRSRHQMMALMWRGQRWYSVDVVKPVSALTVKRPSRKKTPRAPQEDMWVVDRFTFAYWSVTLTFYLSCPCEVSVWTMEHINLYCSGFRPLPVDAQDALHVQAKYTVDGKKREIFFFRDGSAVFWSMPDVERKEVLKFIRKHDIGRYAPSLILRENEEMDLKYMQGPSGVSGDTLQLKEGQEEGQTTLEKYTFSNALAQSVKLAIWEATLETFVDSIEHVTEDLRDGRKIGMSRREVLRKTGELFTLRHLINLSSDLLDTPDFYWDRAGLEPLYMALCNHLDMARRTRVMNEKLSHCCELTELLSSHLNDAHHTRLEVMIIVLILVEVVFEIVHYIERYLGVPAASEGPTPSTSDPDTQHLVAPSAGLQ
ncbi:uncharacterized protein LOC143288232 [Babylonia areolata]|uniref:uncharacterized protein LOC143288232 n=1 Tax=Babylonia areolata TaxID=304850 RepID=UPI003FD50E49